jgi:hypothetical protein
VRGGWDASQVDWTNVALDSISAVSGFFALNGPTGAIRGSREATTLQKTDLSISEATDVTSGAYSLVNGDVPGAILSGVSLAIPGPPGVVVSVISLLYDLDAGWQWIPYQPPIPR